MFGITNAGTDKIHTTLIRQSLDGSQMQLLNPGSVVARFDNSGIVPVEYGVVTIAVSEGEVEAAQPGTYTGRMYFKISVK